MGVLQDTRVHARCYGQCLVPKHGVLAIVTLPVFLTIFVLLSSVLHTAGAQ